MSDVTIFIGEDEYEILEVSPRNQNVVIRKLGTTVENGVPHTMSSWTDINETDITASAVTAFYS